MAYVTPSVQKGDINDKELSTLCKLSSFSKLLRRFKGTVK